MQAFNLEALAKHHEALGQRWSEFLRVEALSAGLYRLPIGSVDLQRPHVEDELYVILRGRAIIRVGDEQRPIAPGDLVYIPGRTEHRFVEINEELLVLVIFAPAEGSSEIGGTRERSAGHQ